jgi:putative transposase
MDYRYGSHTVYQIEYHFVWVTKYRYKVLRGEVAERVRELVRQTCEAFEIRIVRGVVSKDHVPILVSAPPNLAPSEIMRRIKEDMWFDARSYRVSPLPTGQGLVLKR